MQRIEDAVLLGDAISITDDGYLEVNAKVARTGIQIYSPDELGLLGDGPVRVYRDSEEVFQKDSLHTFSGIPITVGHPADLVDADTHKSLSVGHSGQEVLRDGEHLKIGLKITDSEAVGLVRRGVRDLSVGYTCVIDATPGKTPSGETYDARQTEIRANHIAIVPKGRAGTARIGDVNPWGAAPLDHAEKETAMADQKLQTVVFSDEAYTVNDEGTKLHKHMSTAIADAKAETVKLGDKIAKLEAEATAAADTISNLEGKLKDAEITPQKLAAAAKSRQMAADGAKKMGVEEDDMEGMSEEEIKAAAIKKKMGDKAANYTTDQIATAFETLSAVSTRDSLSGPIDTPSLTGLGDAYAARDAALSDAWKTPAKGAN